MKESLHRLHHAAEIDADASRELVARQQIVDLRGHFAQILAGRSDIHVRYALNLVMIDFGGRLHEFDACNVSQSGDRPGAVDSLEFVIRRVQRAFAPALPQRNLRQIDKVVNGGLAVLVILDRQKIVVAGLMVHPVVGRDHGVRVERGDDVVDDLLLGKAEFGGMDAIDFEADGRIVHVLRNIDLADARQFADLRGQVLPRRCRWYPDRGC